VQFEIHYPKYAWDVDPDLSGTNMVVADETDIAEKIAQLSVNLRPMDHLLIIRT
jgi:hypothetical protein